MSVLVEEPVATRPSTGRRARPRLLALGIPGMLAVVVIVLGLYWRSVPQAGDPLDYMFSGRDFPYSAWNAVGYSRYGLTLPIAVLVRIFGLSQIAEYALPLVSGAVLAVATYLLARRRFGALAGVAAAVLLLGNEVVFLDLTRVYPDLPSTAVLAVTLLLALAAADEARRDRGTTRRLVLLLVGVGFGLGLGYEIRETVVFAWPVVAWVLLRSVPLRTLVVTVVPPALAWLGLELALNAYAHGDALIRLRSLAGADINGNGFASDQKYLGGSRTDYLTLIWRLMGQHPSEAWMRPAAVLAVLGGVLFPRRVGLLTVWFLLSVVPFVLLGGVLSPEHPSGRLDVNRYWIAFLLPMVLAAVGTVTEALRRLRARFALPLPARRAVAGAVAVALCAWPVLALAGWLSSTETLAPNGGRDVEQLRAHFARTLPAGATVWGGSFTVRLLSLYERPLVGGDPVWRADLRDLTADGPAPAPGDLVVLIQAHACAFCDDDTATWQYRTGRTPPTRGWHRVWRADQGNVSLWRVG